MSLAAGAPVIGGAPWGVRSPRGVRLGASADALHMERRRHRHGEWCPGSRHLLTGIAVVLLGTAAFATPARADRLALGMQDDAALALWPRDAAGLLALGRSHGVSAVRFIVYPHQDLDRFATATDAAVAQGMQVEVTLAASGLEPESYGRWAVATARRLREHGAAAFSVLNEPDLTLPSGSACDPSAAPEVLRQEGVRVVRRRVARRRAPVRYRLIRRWSRRPSRRRIVVRRRIPAVPGLGSVVVTRTSPLQTATSGAPMTAAPEGVAICRRIIRARVAAGYYRVVIPALRRAAPGAEIWIGETSPVHGVQQFIETLRQEPLPPVDGFAHHPYSRWDGQPSTEDGSLWLDHLGRLPSLLGGLPLYLTEFGVMAGETRYRIMDAEGAAAVWRRAIKASCDVGARQLVAYQWDPNPPGTDPSRWDTSILGHGRTPTPALGVFAAADCSP